MRILLIVCFFLVQQWGFSQMAQYASFKKVDKKFNLHASFPKGYDISKAQIMVQPHKFNCLITPVGYAERKSASTGNDATWELNPTGATWLNLVFIRENGIVWYLAEPGDKISINYDGKKPTFSGKGAPGWELVYRIHELNDSIDLFPERKTISRSALPPDSLQDYLAWNRFLDKKASMFLALIEKYRPVLSNLAYKSIKAWTLTFIEKRRLWKFNYLRLNNKFNEKNQYGLTNQDLCNIYDSTMQGPYAKWLLNESDQGDDPWYLWGMLKVELYRKKGSYFRNSENDPQILGNRPEDSFIQLYEIAKQKFKGYKRELVVANPFYDPKGIFEQVGFSPAADSLLNSYYAEPGFPECKEGVKIHEQRYREKFAKNYASPFSLKDSKGSNFLSDQLRGKIAVVDFWFTGCTGCVQMTSALKKVADHFKNDTNVVFVSISTDKDQQKWRNSIKKGIYTMGDGIQLFTNGLGRNHAIIRDYYVSSYPSLHLIDPSGMIINFNNFKVDPRKDEGKSMIELITHQLAISQDGPYVYYKRPDSATTYNFRNGRVAANEYPSSGIPALESRTDNNLSFTFSLKKSLAIEPAVYDRPEKLFILSDIEGEFNAFKRLLINNGVMDNQFNWTFGKGHLVFAGDMFDRGNQVTECLWLIYSLEEKAKAAGGYVHFILGNHEIMNLQGDHRYVTKKYTDVAAAISKPLKMLYGEKSELGRWLRTKNIMEKIGDLLVLHGGVSPQVNVLSLTIEQINQKSRPCYDCTTAEMTDTIQKTLLRAGAASPFWYRGYYGGEVRNATPGLIDSTLQKFGVQHIITGHSVIADTISVHFDGKIINTDTRHAEGKSEAVLILGDVFYRVSQEGIRHKLNTRPGK